MRRTRIATLCVENTHYIGIKRKEDPYKGYTFICQTGTLDRTIHPTVGQPYYYTIADIDNYTSNYAPKDKYITRPTIKDYHRLSSLLLIKHRFYNMHTHQITFTPYK